MMKYIFEELPGGDYTAYQFPYAVYGQLESDDDLDDVYANGFLQSRIGEGRVYLSRSLRVDLSNFEPSSENRRIMKKTDFLVLKAFASDRFDYKYELGKSIMDFYQERFGDKTFSTQRLKWIYTSGVFNTILQYEHKDTGAVLGYCPSVTTQSLLHYAYPYYSLEYLDDNIGMGMMIAALIYAKQNGHRYVYLGSCNSEKALYKTQFDGVEWFDGADWSTDIDLLKDKLRRDDKLGKG